MVFVQEKKKGLEISASTMMEWLIWTNCPTKNNYESYVKERLGKHENARKN